MRLSSRHRPTVPTTLPTHKNRYKKVVVYLPPMRFCYANQMQAQMARSRMRCSMCQSSTKLSPFTNCSPYVAPACSHLPSFQRLFREEYFQLFNFLFLQHFCLLPSRFLSVKFCFIGVPPIKNQQLDFK